MAETTPGLISIIVLNYHNEKEVGELAKTFSELGGFELVIIDNSKTLDLISNPILPRVLGASLGASQQLGTSNLNLIVPEKNLGFAGGVNLGIKESRGEWIFLLNSDAFISPSDLLQLSTINNQHSSLAAAPRLEHQEKSENSVGWFDGFWQHPLNWLFCRPRHLNMQHSTFNFSTNKQPSTINPTSLKLRGASHQPSTNNYQPFPVDFCSFAAVLFHRSIFEKVGLLDEKNFFMYYEDMDLCLRMKQEGIPILFVPEIKTDHRGSGSSDREPEKKRQYYETSRKNYLLKHRGWLVYLLNAFGFLK